MTNKILQTSEAQQKPEICCSPSTATNCLHQISGANTLMLTTPPCGSVKAAKCVAAKRTEEKRGRGRAWVYIEMLCAVLAVTGVNQDLCDGRSKKERLAHMNTAYKFQVETMVATKKWVDQFGLAEDKTLRDQARRGWRRPPMLFSTLPSFRRPRTASTLLRCMCSSIKGPR